MAIVPIRADNAYVGIGLQTSQGTGVAPTYFPRWMEGSQLEYDGKFEDVWEGDGSRRLSQIIRNLNQVKIKLVCTPRPNELGLLEFLSLGTGSDTITAGTSPSTTLTAGVTGGTSTSCAVAAGTGLSGSGTIELMVGAGTATAELVTFSLPVATLTLTVAATYNGGKFKNNHASSDTVTSPANVNTSLTSTAAAGASSIAVGNNNNNATFPVTLCCSQGTANEEFVTFSSISGAGPYTLTVAATYNGGVTKLAHTSGDVVVSPTTHVETDQVVGVYTTLEVGLGSLSSQGGVTLRVKDCQVESIKRSGKSGGLLMYEVDFVGLVATVQGSPSTVTLENHLPFLFTQGVWTLDGATTGDALSVETFDITGKNNVELVQTESFVGAALVWGQLHTDITIDIVYQSTTTRLQQTYMGGNAGTTDAQAVGTGALSLIFTSADNFNTVQYACTTLVYTKATAPVPKVDGKHYKQTLNATSVSNQGVNTYVLQTTVANTTATVY